MVQSAALCPGDMITKRDKVTREYECVPCLKCRAGHGLSVNCGDVITPQTPIVCQPCVLGETYSSANEPGACKDCENCGKYRETSKTCTLTSKAVCGKCKVGAYPDSLLSICKPCSYCCNDGKDIVIPACQVPGVAKGMQCTYLRSCPKTAAKPDSKTSLSTASIVPSRSATVTLSTPYPTATTITAQGNRSNEEQGTQYRGEQIKSDATFSPSQMVGVIVGPVLGAFAVVGLLVWKFKPSIKQAVKKIHKAAPGDAEIESGIPLQHLQSEDTGSEKNELQAQLELGNPLEQRQGGAETDELQMTVALPNGDTSSPVQESGDSPEPLPVQDTQPPNGLDGPGKVYPVQDTQPPNDLDGPDKVCPVQDTQPPNGLDEPDKVCPVQDTQPPGGFNRKGKNQD